MNLFSPLSIEPSNFFWGNSMSYEEDQRFENEVRRIARARWPQAQYDGATVSSGRERDAVFDTEEVIHYVEATTSKRADKAKEDTKKIFQLISEHQKSGSIKGAIGWFITQDEPTADQRDAVKLAGKNQVKAVSFAQFQQAIVDVSGYFEKRENHLFGSIADPLTGAVNFKCDYVPLDLLPLNESDSISISDIVEGLTSGKAYALLGDYGAGKSMTLREVYYKLRDRYRKIGTPIFPVYVNLREHSGQDDSSELLERHARRIGFERPGSLVAAWRAGFVVLLIDGFDEITSLGISASRSRLREARRRSLEAVRKLLEQTPLSVGYVVAGREHFFSTPDERRSALGLRNGTTTIALGELNRKQVDKYIKSLSGSHARVPDWLPTRPLLVSYLACRGILQQSDGVLEAIDAIEGWDALLDKIFERESKISPSLDGPTLRSILERLATMARATRDGLGPLTQEQIRTAFIQVCDSEPDDQANLLLQRLPGLGIYRHEDDTRTFVDLELAGVCRAKDISDFIFNSYGQIQDEGWLSSMRLVNEFAGYTAIARVCRNIRKETQFEIDMDATFQALNSVSDLDVLKADLSIFCAEMPCEPRQSVVVENAVYENYVFSPSENGGNLRKIKFKDCIFDAIEVGVSDGVGKLPKFQDCLFISVNDRTGKADMPSDKFNDGCSYESFAEDIKTQSSILSTSLSRGEKLVLTILRKVFVQSLSGRSETALLRGLDLNDRPLVTDAIRLIQQHNLLSLYNRGDGNVWIPVRKELNRVRRILASPLTCDDELLEDAKRLIK